MTFYCKGKTLNGQVSWMLRRIPICGQYFSLWNMKWTQ